MVFVHELRKTLGSPAILGVALVALVFNIVMVWLTPKPDWALQPETDPMTNIYQGFSAADIADSYIAQASLTGGAAQRVQNLYDRLQASVDDKAAHGDALDPYMGEPTAYVHGILYGQVLPIALVEAGVLALILSLFAIGYESAAGTDKLVWSSATGRKIWGWKVLASLVASLALAVVILGVSVAVFCWRFSYHGWSSQVSSGFNQAVGGDDKPFITWDRLTVGGYVAASGAVGLGLVVCFSLLGTVVASFVRQAYAAVVGVIAVLCLMFLLPYLLPTASLSRAIADSTPLRLSLSTGQWFTDGGIDVLWPRFETVGLIASGLILALLASAAAVHVKKEDLA